MCDLNYSFPGLRETSHSPQRVAFAFLFEYSLSDYRFLLFILALFFLSTTVDASDGGSCGSNVTANACAADGAGGEESTADPASTESARQAPANVGNPINLITGNKYQ